MATVSFPSCAASVLLMLMASPCRGVCSTDTVRAGWFVTCRHDRTEPAARGDGLLLSPNEQSIASRGRRRPLCQSVFLAPCRTGTVTRSPKEFEPRLASTQELATMKSGDLSPLLGIEI